MSQEERKICSVVLEMKGLNRKDSLQSGDVIHQEGVEGQNELACVHESESNFSLQYQGFIS